MIVTARQLEDLHRQNGANGRITLPYRARLTPLAADWIRARKITIGYSDSSAVVPKPAEKTFLRPLVVSQPAARGTASSVILWWCDGPCGPAKAAITSHERELNLQAIEELEEPTRLVAVVKRIASELKVGSALGAILLVRNGAAAMVFANRCPSIRAILGTCMEAVEQGVREVAANVLILEYPYKTLQQMRNLLTRFARGGGGPNEQLTRQLTELASCG